MRAGRKGAMGRLVLVGHSTSPVALTCIITLTSRAAKFPKFEAKVSNAAVHQTTTGGWCLKKVIS